MIGKYLKREIDMETTFNLCEDCEGDFLGSHQTDDGIWRCDGHYIKALKSELSELDTKYIHACARIDRDKGRIDVIKQLEKRINELTGITNPTCHSGHSDYPLTLWDCPTCVQNEKTQLETEIAQLRKDQAPFQAQIDQLKTYEIRCHYCKRTTAEAEGGYKCSTCKQGGDDEIKEDLPPKVGREDAEHPGSPS